MGEIDRGRGIPGWRRFVGGPTHDRRARPEPPDRRRARRHPVSLRVGVSSIDPVHDRRTGEVYYDTSEHEQVLEISRRGLRLRTDRPPEDGARVLVRLHPPGADEIDLVARTRWSHVQYVPGECGARATAVVGLEVMGGPARSLDAFERWLSSASRTQRASLARPQELL